MQVGGKLAQYAPPAELLTAPAERVRRGLRRRRPRAQAPRAAARARHRPVDGRDRAAPASRRPRCASALADADLDIPLLVDAEQRPLGWLSERGLTGERVRPELRSPAEPIVELDDILRDALSDLLAARVDVRPGRRCRRARRRRALDPGDLACDRPRARRGARARPSASRRPRAGDRPSRRGPVIAPLIAQSGGFLRDRTGDTGCPSNDGICLGWMLDHLDRYRDAASSSTSTSR